ncbi:hypothetical protein CRUP_001810 [Coryphaenoides rupestris]|nr:hypothetical protein CRUP_001810 [Coryphaenoides rupestris]
MLTPYFLENFWGEKNNGFDVLYHNMKHGQISSKELTDFIRERSAIEEAYARSVTKLAKSAGNFSPLGTFAPVWDVFKTSTEKLATCHLELVRKLQELIKEVQKYVDDQAKAHKKALHKSKEIYNAKTVEQERLRKEGATQRDVDKKFQDIEESHILHMREIIQSYSQSVDETHVQIGEVHHEFVRNMANTSFVRNMANTSVEGLIQKLAESKGTGKERPGPIEFEECNAAIAIEGAKPRKRKTFVIPGRRKDKDTDSMESTEVEAANTANGAPPGYYGAIDIQNANSFYSSSDSEDEDEPRKFHVEIKPVQPSAAAPQTRATIDELKASIENIVLSPSTSGQQIRRNQSSDELSKNKPATSYNDKLTNNDLLSLDPFSPALAGSASSVSSSAGPALNRPTTPLTTGALVPPPRPSSRPKLPTGKLTGINEIVRPFSPPKTSGASPRPRPPLARAGSSSSG